MNIENIDDKLDDLQNELLRLANSGSQYMGVVGEICKLREMKQSVLTQKVGHQAKRQQMAEMMDFLNRQTGVISQYDYRLVRRLVECVTVFEGRVVVANFQLLGVLRIRSAVVNRLPRICLFST